MLPFTEKKSLIQSPFILSKQRVSTQQHSACPNLTGCGSPRDRREQRLFFFLAQSQEGFPIEKKKKTILSGRLMKGFILKACSIWWKYFTPQPPPSPPCRLSLSSSFTPRDWKSTPSVSLPALHWRGARGAFSAASIESCSPSAGETGEPAGIGL